MSEVPEGVESVMFLRDGWPLAVVCKVVMTGKRVGIGIQRQDKAGFTPEEMDDYAMRDAIRHVASEPPDYTEILEHVARMKAEAESRVAHSIAATAKGAL